MNQNYYSNIEFSELKKRINHEMYRRSTYNWWDPFTTPTVGVDRSSPLSIPDTGSRMEVTDDTYTINNPSEGSIEPTRNIKYPAHGDNPAGHDPADIYKTDIPNTSAAGLNVDELKNYLVGLSKIQDINLFYGRDELPNTAFRNPQGIEDVVVAAEKSELNDLLHKSDISPTKNDPNGGMTQHRNYQYPIQNHPITYPMLNGKYVMPSGEYDGEEVTGDVELSERNFYDDYGAEPGDSNYHPYNRNVSQQVRRDWHDQDHDRNIIHTNVVEGGKSSNRFGQNPRNPQMGNQYRSKPAYGGKKGSCVGACSGLCYTTCDNECSESCQTTCWSRCGNACTASCGNSCTSCSAQCYQSCRTKCENVTGYSCLKAGAKTVKISAVGGKDGVPAQNTLTYTTNSCQGCSYSCQFYPNKKTECWDAGCMGKCFISCSSSCSTSCYGGCIDNESQKGDGYKSGKGRGCSGGCTLNCIGYCSGVCAGFCINTCFNACKMSCADNCTYTCSTMCGDGCRNGCTNGCTGCTLECSGGCRDKSSSKSCSGCSSIGGCQTSCMQDCNRNCMGWGCRSICGTESAGACESNCRLSCMGVSCTAMCSDACSDQCTTCVNNCGFQCGACVSQCSTGCESACNIDCTEECSNNCSENCVHSCSEECGGCSNLCYSCVGMCISICSVKCENGCSSCANQCGWWCDSSCNRECFSNCSSYCINSCVGSCSTYLTSETKLTKGPDRPPTSDGYIYPHPKNRWEERESFMIVKDIPQCQKYDNVPDGKIVVGIIPNRSMIIVETSFGKCDCNQVVRHWNQDEGKLITNVAELDISNIQSIWKYYHGEYTTIRRLFSKEFIWIYDTDIQDGPFDPDKFLELMNPDLMDDIRINIAGIVKGSTYRIIQTTSTGGVYELTESGEIIINEDALGDAIMSSAVANEYDTFVIEFIKSNFCERDITYDDLEFVLPFGFTVTGHSCNDDHLVVVIKRDESLYPKTMEGLNDGQNQ